jgi:glucose/arabinose dehydrogenase
MDAGSDVVPDFDAPCVTCGVGPKFCDLPGKDSPLVNVPDGFCVRDYYETGIIESRVLRFAPNGDLFIAAPSAATPGGASRGPGAILVLPDDNHDGISETPISYAGLGNQGTGACTEADSNDLSCVHGLVFSEGYLYFTRSDEVRRFPYVPGARKAPSTGSELVARLGGNGRAAIRWTHTLDVGRDGTLYVSRGQFESTDTCNAEQMTLGAVFALRVKGAALPVVPEVLANGFRNPMYIRASARSGELYAAELTGDSWGGIGGREKLATIASGGRWGYPCCVSRGVPSTAGTAALCADVSTELASFPLSNTPFGFDFERGAFPEPYKHGVFFALHGAFGRPWTGTGIAWVKTDPATGRPTGTPSEFASGWASNFLGRATDLAFAPDGRMFIIDDTLGRIFWIAPRTLNMPM